MGRPSDVSTVDSHRNKICPGWLVHSSNSNVKPLKVDAHLNNV